MRHDFRETPIVRKVLPWTGKLDGDDSGYRNVAVHNSDNEEEADPLVRLHDGAYLRTYYVYQLGAKPLITPFYGKGLGVSTPMLIRRPAYLALITADALLRPFHRQLLVLDAWRPMHVQAKLWHDIRNRLLRKDGKETYRLSLYDEVLYGLRADDTGSFAPIVTESEQYQQRLADFRKNRTADVESAFPRLHEARPSDVQTMEDVERLYITFLANLGVMNVPLDLTKTTAHGGGGAADLWMVDTETDKPVNLGVPFDSTNPAAVMDFFEKPDAAERYREAVASSPELQQYLHEFGIEVVNPFVVEGIRCERRMLFHAVMATNATYFSLGEECGEPWHFNLPCERGGVMADTFPLAGSGCQSILQNVRGPDGNYLAVWGSQAAHMMAKEFV